MPLQMPLAEQNSQAERRWKVKVKCKGVADAWACAECPHAEEHRAWANCTKDLCKNVEPLRVCVPVKRKAKAKAK